MRKKARQPVEVGNILEKIIKSLGIAGQVKLVRIMMQWDKVFDPPISQVTFAKELKGKTLFVNVENSVWLQQLSFMDNEMIAKINKNLGSKSVNRIRFSVGKIPEKPEVEKSDPVKSLNDILLSNEDLDEISGCITNVSDLELRKSLRRIILKDKKLKKYRVAEKIV